MSPYHVLVPYVPASHVSLSSFHLSSFLLSSSLFPPPSVLTLLCPHSLVLLLLPSSPFSLPSPSLALVFGQRFVELIWNWTFPRHIINYHILFNYIHLFSNCERWGMVPYLRCNIRHTEQLIFADISENFRIFIMDGVFRHSPPCSEKSNFILCEHWHQGLIACWLQSQRFASIFNVVACRL